MKKLFFGLKAKAKSVIRNSRKQLAIGLTIGAVAVGVSAYTNAENKDSEQVKERKTTMMTYELSFNGNPAEPSDWINVTNSSSACPNGEDLLCQIKFDADEYDIDAVDDGSLLDLVSTKWLTTPNGGKIMDGSTETNITIHKRPQS